jgi:hypothetical protein
MPNTLVDVLLVLIALLGHAAIWLGLLNRIHGTAMPRRLIDALTLGCFLMLPLVPGLFSWWFLRTELAIVDRGDWSANPWPLVYLAACWLTAVAATGLWVVRRLAPAPSLVRWHRRRSLKLARPVPTETADDHVHHFLVHLPGNETLQLDLWEHALELPRLAPELEGLSVVHLSDLHFTGRVGKHYFRDVVDRCNELEPDLVALTGDLVDTTPCIDWVPELLGSLEARYGSYVVLGNHDLEVDVRALRRALGEAGLVDLGGSWKEVSVGGSSVVLAGNELPWLPPAADMQSAPPPSSRGGPLRIALSHSPDQLPWAQAHGFDLLLAGHTHGGQIRLPVVGAVLTPSLSGVKYACGLFSAPPTIMHVSRGISGLYPVRMNCPPEMSYLVLHRPAEG